MKKVREARYLLAAVKETHSGDEKYHKNVTIRVFTRVYFEIDTAVQLNKNRRSETLIRIFQAKQPFEVIVSFIINDKET